MTEISTEQFFDWLADDGDASYDAVDFVTEFCELLGIVVDD